ncbi:MAG: serine/threonine-protein kinase [Kofleriaceae bacterium]
MIGRVLAAKYRLDEEIGAGSMGRVYRAHQLGLSRDVAVKILHPLMAADEGALLRFAREAKVAARLVHPVAVSVLDYGVDEGVPFLVMELIEGETLRQRLTREPLPREHAVAIAGDIADALIAAHEIRLIHRDIKPENTFLQKTTLGERVRVVDFGLAFLATGEEALGRMTLEGYVGGTPAYMAPEQVHGRGVGPAADIYALGCTLYEMIAGHPPFRGTLAELLTSQAYSPPRPLRLLDLSPPVTPELDHLILAMLSKSAPMRPGPSAVWQALHDLAAEVPSRATAPAYVSERSARALVRASPRDAASGTQRPTLPRELARGSDHAAVPAPQPAPAHGEAELERPELRVLAIGELDDEAELGLVAAGCTVERARDGDEPGAADVIWAPGVSDARLAELAARAPVVTDLGVRPVAGAPAPAAADATADADARAARIARAPAAQVAHDPSLDALLRRLRAGAADLLLEPTTPDELARKLLRAARRPARGR